MDQQYRLLIDGQLVDGASAMDVVNPATGVAFAKCPRAHALQLDAAVAAAKRAFPAWAATSMGGRRDSLLALAAALERDVEGFARLLTLEQGKPLAAAAGEIYGAVATLRGVAAMDLPVEVLRETAHERIVRRQAPLGVVAAITPWNSPVLLLAMKLAPALLAGNTLVAKPAATTPLTTLRLGELCAEIFPAGVVNIIADANDLGSRLTAHPDVAKIAFTGSTATGRRVMADAAQGVKRLTLELGGNDAALVLDDADPATVAAPLFAAAMGNSGQVCLATKRIYAHRSVYDALCAELAALAERAVVGDGLEQGVEIGPIQNRAQFEKLKGYLETAHADGRVIAGGQVLDRPGYFIAPTIVRDIADDSRLVREEQFGPILPVLSYDNLDEAIDRINDTPYGLGGTVWTSDPDRGQAAALRIDAGTVWVNRFMEFAFDVSYRASKQSGFGAALGQDGLHEFTQAMIVSVGLEPATS